MKPTMRGLFYVKGGIILLCAVLSACGGSPAPISAQQSSPPDELDAAVRETSDYLNNQLSKGNKLVILNVQSEFPALSEYIIDELIANTVNDRIFSVVDRQQLNTIRAELNFQMSGEVSDESAQNIGQMLGAQIIISGAVSKIGDLYRLRIRALSVESAEIEGQFNRNIPDGPTVTALVNSKATGYGDSAVIVSGTNGAEKEPPAPAVAPVPPPEVTLTVPEPAPPPSPEPAPAEKVYQIGDKGPAGGIVFYDMGFYMDGWRYLEAAPQDFPAVQWGPSEQVGGTQTAVGSGKRNTERLVSYFVSKGETTRAAQVADAAGYGGYNDWFLPSLGELDLMYKNLKQKNMGNFKNGYYWSSSEGGLNSRSYARYQNFSDGNAGSGGISKSDTFSVRACRQF